MEKEIKILLKKRQFEGKLWTIEFDKKRMTIRTSDDNLCLNAVMIRLDEAIEHLLDLKKTINKVLKEGLRNG
jgi:hypothetical protein